MPKPFIAAIIALLVLALYLANRSTVKSPDDGRGYRALRQIEQFFYEKLDKQQCPRPIYVFYGDDQGSREVGSNVWLVSGYIEITNRRLPWTATLRDRTNTWWTEGIRIDGSPVNKYGRILPEAFDPGTTNRGLAAFKATVDYMRHDMRSSSPIVFSSSTGSESGWTNVGPRAWRVHGDVRVGNELSQWVANVEDFGDRWHFQDLRIENVTTITNGESIKGLYGPFHSGSVVPVDR